jgi:hypothetical protein
MKALLARFALCIALVIVGTAFMGCIEPITRSVRSGAMPQVKKLEAPSPYSVQVGPVVDRRPVYETEDFDQSGFRYFVPALIWWQWSTAGPVFANPEHYDLDLLTSLRGLMSDVINRSSLGSPNASVKYILKPELLHFYGVGYTKGMFIATMGAAAMNKYQFYPAGYVSLKLTLYEASTKKPVAIRYLSDSFLFNPAEPTLGTGHSAQGGMGMAITNNKSQVAILALKNAMQQLPETIGSMLADVGPGRGESAEPTHFMLVRLTDEYDFQEELVIEIATGRIARNTVEKRTAPIVSCPGEWIVSPIAADGHYMSAAEYVAFVEVLKQKYNIEFKGNLSAAQYLGPK